MRRGLPTRRPHRSLSSEPFFAPSAVGFGRFKVSTLIRWWVSAEYLGAARAAFDILDGEQSVHYPYFAETAVAARSSALGLRKSGRKTTPGQTPSDEPKRRRKLYTLCARAAAADSIPAAAINCGEFQQYLIYTFPARTLFIYICAANHP